MAQTTTSMRRGNAGEDTRRNATRPRGNTKSQRGDTGGTQRRAPRRDFGRLTKLPSGKYRARYPLPHHRQQVRRHRHVPHRGRGLRRADDHPREGGAGLAPD